jgi:hypothetical protein
MGNILARAASGRRQVSLQSASFAAPFAVLLLACASVWLSAGCHQLKPLETAPLDNAGMNYDAIQQLKSLDITAPEVTEIAKARQSGLSDSNCVQLVTIFHGRGQPFDAGDAVTGFAQAGMTDDMILQLARLNQLGLGAGELEAMHLAGLSDEITLEVARHQAAGQPVLAGATLAGLKNAGVRSSTLLELVRHGVPDSQASAIFAYRRHGASDAELLRRFASS